MNSEEKKVRYGFILTAAAMMFLGVWAMATLFAQATEKHRHFKQTKNPTVYQASVGQLHVNPVFKKEQLKQVTQQLTNTSNGTRTLKQYYSRRIYAGSPPLVPHAVVEKNGKVENCLGCHEKGGYVPKYKSYAPVTPHPSFKNCSQCHLPKQVNDLFRKTNWASTPPPKLGHSPLPGGPPPVPHSLLLRKNCLSCHWGPGAVKKLRTPHPQRTNCMQCHLPTRKTKPFPTSLGG